VLVCLEVANTTVAEEPRSVVLVKNSQPAAVIILAESIFIGDQPTMRELNLDAESFEHNEYLCRVEPGRIVLLGRDAPTSVGVHINFNSLVNSCESLYHQL